LWGSACFYDVGNASNAGSPAFAVFNSQEKSSVFSSKDESREGEVVRKQWSEELRCVEIVKKRIRQREEDLLRAFKGNVNFKWPLPLSCNARGKPYTHLSTLGALQFVNLHGSRHPGSRR
jgi:hypothetical protein